MVVVMVCSFMQIILIDLLDLVHPYPHHDAGDKEEQVRGNDPRSRSTLATKYIGIHLVVGANILMVEKDRTRFMYRIYFMDT